MFLLWQYLGLYSAPLCNMALYSSCYLLFQWRIDMAAGDGFEFQVFSQHQRVRPAHQSAIVHLLGPQSRL